MDCFLKTIPPSRFVFKIADAVIEAGNYVKKASAVRIRLTLEERYLSAYLERHSVFIQLARACI